MSERAEAFKDAYVETVEAMRSWGWSEAEIAHSAPWCAFAVSKTPEEQERDREAMLRDSYVIGRIDEKLAQLHREHPRTP